MISVCMCTYNGEKFIEEQLESIRTQTMQADEVIICDDISEDETVTKIKAYIEKHSLYPKWKLIVNTENKGYPGNFYYCMSLGIGDIVFLSDQDDIWRADKIERMCDVLKENSDAKVVSCKFGLIDEHGKKLHTVMQPTYSAESKTVAGISVKQVFYKSEWPGMVLAYRREWYERKGGCTTDGGYKAYAIPHDILVCAMAAEEDGLLQMDEELAYHRRHDNNAGGEEHRIGTLLDNKRKLREIEEYIQFLKCFEEEHVLKTERGRAVLTRKLEVMQGRYAALNSGSWFRVLQNAWLNCKDVRPATVICDLLIVKGYKRK